MRQQKYCSVSCSRKLRWGRFLENHPDYYHAEYEKRAKAKAGTEKVRVRHEKSQKPSVRAVGNNNQAPRPLVAPNGRG